jgi:tetratricopeptide (TPR) repeat protein
MAVVAWVVATSPLPAQADKKKPGLFDFDVPKLPVQYERDAAKDVSPGTIDLSPAVAAKGEARVLRVRIYADRDYRNVVLRWQSKARAQINRINGVVQPVFNVRFEVESLKDWDATHVGTKMPSVLDDLRALDPAKDVDLVVGFATPARGVATSIHTIGQSGLLGRHLLMRGMDDEQEAVAIDQEFRLLSPDERRKLYGDRKAHKEIVVFLHEWGHSLGLLHNEQATNIMNPRYDPRQSSFSDHAKRVINLVVDRRVARRSEPYPETADLVRLLETAPPDEGSDQERAELLAFARQRARGGGRSEPAGRADGIDLPPADVDAFNRAVEALNARRPAEAWSNLAPVIERAGKRQTGPKTWAHLGGLASAAGALTAAEDAAARGGGHAELAKLSTDVANLRQQVCLPRETAKSGVAPEDEPVYVAGYWDAARAIASQDLPTARERLRSFQERHPDAGGADLLGCDLELRARRLPAAKQRCEAAVTKCRHSARAHYLMGMVAANSGKQAAAEVILQKAITIDPTDEGPWLLLARIYRSRHAKQQLADLAARHQTLLSTPLPKD